MSEDKFFKNLAKIDPEEMIVRILEEQSKFIADLNREQLAEDGVRPDGSDITPGYTPFTVKVKELFGKGIGGITDHVTLYNTGRLHKSIFSEVIYPDIVLDSKDSKVMDLEEKYGMFLGLTDESMEKLRKRVIPIFCKRFDEQLRR